MEHFEKFYLFILLSIIYRGGTEEFTILGKEIDG